MTNSKKRVLLIDDEELMLDVFQDLLKEAGFEIVRAKNTTEALDQMKKDKIHAVLLDIGLEGEDGLTFLPKFKALYPLVPVVILTGIGYDNSKIKTALECGASGYFSKETGLENIIPLVEQLMKDPSKKVV
jgi:DNA-binding NarL/FixJ family response regulator